MQNRKSVPFGLLISALGGFLLSFDLPLLRLAQSDAGTLILVRGLMLFFSISVLWILLERRSSGQTPFIAGVPGLFVALASATANIALIGATLTTNTANVVFILAMVPLLAAVFSRIFIGEPVHAWTWVAIVLALAGVAIIVWNSVQVGSLWGDGLALLCAVCMASTITIIRATKRNLATSLALGSYVSALFGGFYLTINLTGLMAPAMFGVPGWVWLALNGLIIVPLASTLVANGPRFLPSADASMFLLLETALAPVWVWLLLGETPSSGVLMGGFIILLTLLVHSLWRLLATWRKDKPQPFLGPFH